MPDNLRVAYYLPRFPKLFETFILREMLSLREMGLDVQVFSLMPPLRTPTMHQQVQDMLPYVHYSPFLFSFKLILAQFHFLFRTPHKYWRALQRAVWQTWPEPDTLWRVLAIFPKAVYFAKQLQELKVDHIHAHFVWLNGIAAQVAADLTGITYSLHAHAWDIFQRKRECVRRQLELATAIVTISEYHRQYLAELCPRWPARDIRVVHCGLDPAEFTAEHVPAVDEVVRVMSNGRMIEKKGFEFLIDACARLAEKGYLFHCSIIGDGPLRKTLQARIDQYNLQGCVSLLGFKSISDVQNLYNSSDIFALPCVIVKSGDRDGIPVVLMEAMAMQVPVITTPVSGNPELVCDGETGLLVPERDAQSLALAIGRLINDPSLRSRLGEQGRQTILAGFDIHQTAAQMAEIFQEIHHSCI
jgi:glycosyltransferase involved in cell wall biosynthesis